MKKRFLALLIAPLALTSCSLLNSSQSYETYAEEIGVYNIDKLDAQNTLTSGFQTAVTARFIENEKYIPYLTLKQYASLYDVHFADDVKSEVDEGFNSCSWTVYKGKQPCFVTEINYYTEKIILAGSLDAAYKDDDDPRDLVALNYGLDIDGDVAYLSNKTYATFSFKDLGIKHFEYNNEHYFPLGLLDITYVDSSTIYFTYNYTHILSTRDVDNYETVSYIDTNLEHYTFDSQMEEKVLGQSIPQYLIKYNANLFIYMMNNFYGLKEYKGIKSFASYYKVNGIYSSLFSENDRTRGMAYSDALSILDDNHTLLVSANKSWGEDSCGLIRRYGQGCFNRSELRTTLQSYRTRTYGSATPGKTVLYSQDRKTALFSFDSFMFGTSKQVFNEDGSIKADAGEYDTYFLILNLLQELKSQGTVENVVLDVSLNGGGVVGVMLKLLCLLSKENSSRFAIYEDTSSSVVNYRTRIDLNGDNKYETNECFGNDFNFYILTSDYSFSCANAFPCAAQVQNHAKIIGQKSGGGECAVSIHYMPNSEYVYHSSNLHLGSYNEEKKQFNGFEGGAKPDIALAIDQNFYSVEAINTAIQNAQ